MTSSVVGNEQHAVGARDHAEVAVMGLGGVHEDRRGACRRQCRGDLARDDARLAYSNHHHTACRGLKRVESVHKALVHARRHVRDHLRLMLEQLARLFDFTTLPSLDEPLRSDDIPHGNPLSSFFK